MIEKEFRLRSGVILRNRIVKSAMSEALADEFNNPSDALINLFSHWGESGAAMLITGNVQLCRRHLEHAGNVVLDGKTDMAKMREWASAGKKNGAKFLVQLSHAGRQTPLALNPHPLSISEVPLSVVGHGKPCAMDEEQLGDVITSFARAAVLACDAGFDGVEIHAAHGWLLSSSLSPKINNRRDGWGGSLENRARLLRESVLAVRKQTRDDFIIAVKLNASDFQKGGFEPKDAAAVAAFMRKEGVDFLEISGGNYESPAAYHHAPRLLSREGYFLEYARDIKEAAGGFQSWLQAAFAPLP